MGRLLQGIDIYDAAALTGFCMSVLGAYAIAGWPGVAVVVGAVVLSIGIIGGVNGRT